MQQRPYLITKQLELYFSEALQLVMLPVKLENHGCSVSENRSFEWT